MAHQNRKRPFHAKWPDGFPDGQTRSNRRQHTKSRAAQRKLVAAAKKGKK